MPFVEYLPSTALPALSDLSPDEGKSLLQGWGDMLDTLAQRARDSARAALLDLCGDDALGAHGVNSNLERAPGELAAAFRAYLQTRFTRHARGGTFPELELQLRRLGFTSVAVVPWVDLALNGNPGAFGGYTSFWYLIIKKPNLFHRPGRWADGTGQWAAAPYLWGIGGATAAQLENLKRVVKRWSPAGSSCRFIEIVLATNIFGIPTDTVRIPMFEVWQRQANGSYYDLYNTTF